MLQSLCKNSFAGAFKANLILQKYNKLGFFWGGKHKRVFKGLGK